MLSSNENDSKDEPFPWHLGVFDAHCHPTDTVSSAAKIAAMRTQALTIMATRRQDQQLVADFADRFGIFDGWMSSNFVVPSFGWHPWFSHQIIDDVSQRGGTTSHEDEDEHYRQVIVPSPKDEDFLACLPETRALSSILQECRTLLQRYPHALVGEVGLDRSFRIPGPRLPQEVAKDESALTSGARDGRTLSPYRVDMAHQRQVLIAQLKLAAELQRPVSVHGVAAHGLAFETISAIWHGYERKIHSKREQKKTTSHPASGEHSSHPEADANPRPYPPRICLHSFSGPIDVMKRYLQPEIPVTFYFSFSTLVNFSHATQKSVKVIEVVPFDRMLVESDLHAAGERMDELMEDIVRRVCRIKGWSLTHGVSQLATNWQNFVFGKMFADVQH